MIPTLHPDDRAHVDAVVAELRGHRRRLELTCVQVAEKLGRGRGAIRTAEVETNRRTGTLQAYAYGLDVRLVFDVPGCPDVFDPQVAALERMAKQARDWRRRHSFERAALGAQLAAVRRRVGMSQADVAAKLGRDQGFLSNLEQHNADDPLLGNYQQVARVLGGQLRMRLVPAGVCDEVRLRALLDELGEHAVVAAVRYRAVTPYGQLKGISLSEAQTAVAEHGGQVEHAEAWLLPTRHEVLGPWLPFEERGSRGPA